MIIRDYDNCCEHLENEYAEMFEPNGHGPVNPPVSTPIVAITLATTTPVMALSPVHTTTHTSASTNNCHASISLNVKQSAINNKLISPNSPARHKLTSTLATASFTKL